MDNDKVLFTYFITLSSLVIIGCLAWIYVDIFLMPNKLEDDVGLFTMLYWVFRVVSFIGICIIIGYAYENIHNNIVARYGSRKFN